jgi:hypothetical protein
MRRIPAFVACMFLWVNVPSHAAEISCASLYAYAGAKEAQGAGWEPKRMPTPYVTCLGGFLNGQISKGDYDKVAAFIRAHFPFLRAFSLASPGGDVDEAIKIGRLFRKYLMVTLAPIVWSDGDFPSLSANDGSSRDLCRGADCACASACALVWMGGVNRGGTVGLHRPRIVDPMFRGLPPADASTAYRRVMESIAAYLNEVEVPKSVIESMVATGSSDIIWVGGGGAVDDPPSIAEWVEASCGSSPLMDAINKGKRTTRAEVDKHADCVRRLYFANRSRLAPP